MKLRRRRRVQDARLSARARVPRASGVGGATTGTTELVLRLCATLSVLAGFALTSYALIGIDARQRRTVTTKEIDDSHCSDLQFSDRPPDAVTRLTHFVKFPLETMRTLAQRSAPEDEKVWAGVVHFEHSSANLTARIGRLLGDPAALARCRRQTYHVFRHRFDAAAIFRRAKVPDLLRSLGWRLPPRSGEGRAQGRVVK